MRETLLRRFGHVIRIYELEAVRVVLQMNMDGKREGEGAGMKIV